MGARGPRSPGHPPGRPWPRLSPTSTSPSGWPRPRNTAAQLIGRGYLYLNLALTFTGQHAEALAAAETARQRLVACGDRIGVAGLEGAASHTCTR